MTESRTVASQPRGLWSRVAGGRSNPLPGQLWLSQLLQIGAFLALALAWPAGAVAQTAVLYSDGFEDRPEVNVQVRGANQPYTARTIGLTQEKSHSGKTSVKIDVTTMHGFEVQLAPRTTAKPGVEWGSIGGAGSFSLPGLDIPLQRDRGYVLEAWVWVEKGPSSGVRIDVATVVDSHYGPVAASLVAGGTTKTGSWVKIEQELTASLLEKKDAAGDKVDGLRLQAVSYASFLPGAGELTAYVDDVSLREVPLAEVAAWRAKDPAFVQPPDPPFARIPEAEDLFVWGAIGGMQDPGYVFDVPSDKVPVGRPQQIEQVRRHADWLLLDLRRHYCNTLVQVGGMLFPLEEQPAYDYPDERHKATSANTKRLTERTS